MTKKEVLITQEGLDKLKTELKDLVEVKRPDAINRIKSAKELGDLSENAEYASAKDDQSFIEGRIQELEEVINHAKVITNGHGGKAIIEISSVVEVSVEGDKDTYELVGPAESNPAKGKISIDSPVGKALLGHKEKEDVAIKTPDGEVIYKILSVK